jgi:predicted glycogen debranching enzyme
MDTNYPACTPRVGYPVEIQALWIAALRFAGGAWGALAAKAERSVMTYFANGNGLADCLDAPNGEAAAVATRDDAIRPNQLFALSLDAVRDPATARRMLATCARLLVPGGVRSLAEGHPLYKGLYTGDEDTRRKPAYHNGTVWAWPFPLYAEAAARYGVMTREHALSLLTSSVENLNAGCVCHISEIADGEAPHNQKGCRAQAWSVSELLRVWQALSA